MTIKLHCFGESGHSYKVALSMQLAGLDWEPVFIDFFNGANRTPEFLSLNPMGEAPVFVDGDLTISQSAVILDHISEKTGKFGGSTPEERREIMRWLHWDNHKLSGVSGMTRFLMNFLPEDKRPKEVIAFNLGRLKIAYKILNAHLEGRDWVVGDSLTNADLTCCAYMFYPEPYGFDRKAWPNIDAWLDRIASMPNWKHPYDLMPGSPADRT